MPKWVSPLVAVIFVGTLVHIVTLALQADPGMKSETVRAQWAVPTTHEFSPKSRPDVTCFVLTGSRIATGGLSCFKE